jgi:hypothetical protein
MGVLTEGLLLGVRVVGAIVGNLVGLAVGAGMGLCVGAPGRGVV